MKKVLFTSFLLFNVIKSYSQNYTSIGDGLWTNTTNWNNISGAGSSTPPTDGTHASGTITMDNILYTSSDYSGGGATLNISAGKTLTINGNFISTTGTMNISGNLIITGNTDFKGTVNLALGATLTMGGDLKLSAGSVFNVNGSTSMTNSSSLTILNGTLQINPGGAFKTEGNVIVNTNNYLIVGTNVLPPSYSDLVIKGDLDSYNGGDVTVQKNGRVAIGGDLTDHFFNATFDIKNGGQAYIGDDIVFLWAGSQIKNANTSSPYGLYVNDVTYTLPPLSNASTNLTDKTTMESLNDPFAQWVANSLSNPLPVEWKSVSIKKYEGNVLISWGTYSEKNNAYFEIEKSVDGLTWEIIGKINGSGTTSVETNYSFSDEAPAVGLNYYRIKQVDFDGKFDYSAIAVINIEEKSIITGLYPNPNDGTFSLALDDVEIDNVSIKTTQGIVINANLTKTQNGYEVELVNPLAGFYTVTVTSQNLTYQAKFIVK